MRTPFKRHCFVIHGVDHARAVLNAACGTGRQIALWSAPGAAAYIGAPMFLKIVDTAASEFPEIDVIGVLDCARNPGFALAAFRHGVAFVWVDLPPETLSRVSDIARQTGATIVRERPPALDLADIMEPVATCRNWLSKPRPQ